MEEFDLENVDGMLSSPQTTPVQPAAPQAAQQNRKPGLWEDLDIKPKDISDLKFKSSDVKTFTVFENGRITSTKLESIKKIAERLFQLGFIYRSPAENRNKVDQAIRSIPGARVQVYKLWAKARDDNAGFQVVSEKTTRIAYEVACGLKKKFLDYKPMIRCVIARDVQMLLGSNCDDPATFIIVYTDKGEVALKGGDIQSIGSVTLPMQVATRANINLFNINSPKFIEEFKKFLDITKPKNPPTQATEIVISDTPAPAAQPAEKVAAPVDDELMTNTDDLF